MTSNRDSRAVNLAASLGVTKHWLVRTLKETKNLPVQSRKGRLGQIRINPVTGTPNNGYATHAIRRLERNVEGGKFDVAEKLQAAGNLSDSEKLLVELILKKSRRRSKLVSLVAESGVDPARVIKLYAEGAIALGKAEALAVAAEGLGAIARQLVKQAAIHHVNCLTCLGLGTVPRNQAGSTYKNTTDKRPPLVCPTCRGQKLVDHTDKHYKFAVTKLLDMAALGKAGSDINVQTNVAVQQLDSTGFMERLTKLTDGSGQLTAPIEVHVLPEASQPETGQSGS